MSSAGVMVLLGALALAASAGWWLWRRRQLALAGRAPKYWTDERTLCTTYEDLGIARSSRPEAEADDENTCSSIDERVGAEQPTEAASSTRAHVGERDQSPGSA